MTDEQLEQTFNELLDADCPCEMGDLLSPLSKDDLESIHEHLLDQFGQELCDGALERSDWLCGAFIINANQGPICFLETALGVVRAEIERRKATAGGDLAAGLPNWKRDLLDNNYAPYNVILRCTACGWVWSPNLRSGGRLPKGYWKCPGGCNHDAFSGGRR
jgi:hypothetical protein